MAEINKNLMKVLQINQQVKAVAHNCETCGGPHSYNDCLATVGQTQNVCAAGAYQGGNSYQPQGSKTLPSNIVTNPKEDLKGITTRSGTAYQGPTILTTSSSKVIERETEVTKDTVPPTNNGSTKHVQPPIVQIETPTFNYEPVVAPVSALKPNQKPSIPYLSRLHDQKLRDKANDQKGKFFKIFKDLAFNISFADALILMPKFGPTIKNLLTNKDKLFELARTPLNEHCSAVLLKKLPEKLGDPDKFLIPCNFPGMDECFALADLVASINLMPLFLWNKLSLPKLTPTLMTLKLSGRSIFRPIGVAKDVFVKVGKFHFPANFVVVDFDADPQVPLILRRSFLKTERALIYVYVGELTIRVNNEVVTFNLDQTSRYSANYNCMTANQIDVIDMACGGVFSKSSCDFLLEEVNAFLALEDDPTSLKVYHSYYDTYGEILLLEAFLNDDPSLPPPTQGMYLPQIQKELKICEAKNDKSSINEPPERFSTKEGLIQKSMRKRVNFTRLVMGWRARIDYRKLNEATLKDHFPLPFMDQVLERLARNEYYCFLDGFSGYFQIPIDPKDQEKTTFTCSYGTFSYRRMPFGLCNAPDTFQRCMMAIFHDMIEKTMEVFMDDFSVFGNSFGTCLSHLDKMLKPCENTNLYLNWEKSHSMVKEGIGLDHKISKNEIKVDKAKVDVIAKLPYPTTVKGV
nr:reverse transcriptase domain-containing protein [Tanacetum cinerariifolium]